MGAVATTEQAIINEAHRRDMVVPDKPKASERDSAAGAFVATPKKGYHDWVGSMDLNSLYPSVFRALNMAPETIVGQLDPSYTLEEITNAQKLEKKSFADAWHGKFGTNEFEFVRSKDVDHIMKLEMEDGGVHEVTGADVYNLVYNSGQPWNISANGTIFTTDVQGIVPGLLELWYTDRQRMQKKKKQSEGAEQTYWDKRQLVKKIQLNSLYGAILNPHCRFYDKRIGQSTTLTGRAITKHMAAETNRMFTGEYDYEGETIIYGDTDSVYFSAAPVMQDQELDMDSAIKLYDHVSDTVSDTFPKFLKDTFNVPLERGAVMIAGREVVGRAGLFLTKKRYGILCLDIEGYQPEGGKLKAMGLEIKRSDTPEFIQDFLEELLVDCLNGLGEEHVIDKIKEFKKYFKGLQPWGKGMPKRANNVTMYTSKMMEQARMPQTNSLHKLDKLKNEGKSNMIPGHVRASINWNNLKKANSDAYSLTITDGAKVVVCKLKNNPMGYTSVAYPTDELNLPQWFKDLPFDEEAMEETVLDKKVANVIGPMGFDLSRTTQSETLSTFFEF
jgi:DNA polymerase elongation subunit (family B)